jgi:diadenosine tetraphosphate (Ap4A) HIT family hydrolase
MPQARPTMFKLHPDFAATSEPLGDLALCHVRLQADARWPWLVLIPKIADAREIEDLTPSDRVRLMAEIVRAGGGVRAIGQARGRPVEKLNVGQLGNLTPQLHVHVVGRRADDAAWPGPVWGVGTAQAYALEAMEGLVAAGRRGLNL